jgi:maleylpyruvate isomerase
MFKLHGFFRSSAAYRVRIALNLKGLAAEQVFHNTYKGEQRTPEYLQLNPQGLVPLLEIEGGGHLSQSLAIIEWLNETHPDPALLPTDAMQRAKARAFALAIACDIHPVQNLRVLKRLQTLGIAEPEIQEWGRWANEEGLAACERLVAAETGPFCFGATPSVADVCLVPQLSNARRFQVEVSRFTRLLVAETACKELAAFRNAAPENQPDAE